MQREQAMRLAGAAAQAYSELVQFRQQMAVALMSLLPDGVSAIAVSPDAAAPGIWAVSESSFYRVLVDTYEQEETGDRLVQITCDRRALVAGEATISVRERLEWRGQATVRQRHWEFTLAVNERAIFVETEQLMRGGFPDERGTPPEEELARALARALGFAIPSEDIGQNEY
jgi:hypothetical protein